MCRAGARANATGMAHWLRSPCKRRWRRARKGSRQREGCCVLVCVFEPRTSRWAELKARKLWRCAQGLRCKFALIPRQPPGSLLAASPLARWLVCLPASQPKREKERASERKRANDRTNDAKSKSSFVSVALPKISLRSPVYLSRSHFIAPPHYYHTIETCPHSSSNSY